MNKKYIIKAILSIALLPFSLNAVEISGYIVSDNQKTISSRNMGYIKKVYVKEGDVVKSGMPLFDIDSKDMDALLNQAKLAKSQAFLSLGMYQNSYKDLIINYGRLERLYKKDIVSKHELEQVGLAKKNLESMISIVKEQIKQADAQVQSVINQYNYLNVKSPSDAVVIQKNIAKGEMAIPGSPMIVLSDIKNQKAEILVSEKLLKYIHKGKVVTVIVPSIDFKTKGKISVIIPDGDKLSHSFRVKIEFDTNEKEIYPGMYTTIEIGE